MKPKFWIGKKIYAKKGNDQASELKSYLDGLVGKCETIVNRKISEGKSITRKQLERELFEQNHANTKSTIPLSQYLESVVNREFAKGKIVEKTKKNYLWGLKHIVNFDGDVPIVDVDAVWLEGFLDHMKFTAKLSDNSIASILNYTKKIIHHAIYQDGILEKDPFKTFTFSRANEGDKEYLTVEELQRLHKIYMNEELLEHKQVFGHSAKGCHFALQIFLTGCYTGLRFSDVTTLELTDFYGNIIRKKMQKTLRFNKWVSVPITTPLKEILSLDEKSEGDSVFLAKPYNNSHINKLLKAICSHAKINKSIRFHGSRHTFACVALELGMSLEVVSSILGHSTLKQTQTYAKIQNQRVQSEMEAFNSLGGVARKTKLKKVS